MTEYLKIPEERLKLLLENNKKLLKEIQESTNTSIEVDEELCQLTVLEKSDKNPLSTWRARDILKAIGRGFEPEVALNLLDENNELKVIDLKEFAGKKKNALERIKGRVIGRKGKSKNIIQDLTDTEISIYGKTVSVIGSARGVELATKAITMLASGTMHSTAFKMIEQEISK